MRNMQPVTQQQLQGVLTRRQFKRCFSLTFPKMQIIRVRGNRHISVRQRGINNQVMMASIFSLNTCGCDSCTG